MLTWPVFLQVMNGAHCCLRVLGLGALMMMSRGLAAQDAAPTRRVVEVQWPDAALVEPPPPFSARVARTVSTVRLPVLVPAIFAGFNSFEVVSDTANDYTASVRAKGAKFSINGTRQASDPPPGAATAMVMVPDATAALQEPDPPEPRIVDRGFTRYGAAYLITVECARPADARCSDAYLDRLERSVRLFGGTK